MTQEEKKLLLKDLSARLPYGVKFGCDVKGWWALKGITYNGNKYICFPNAVDLEVVKPYLRPMSSMIKEERQEMEKIIGSNPIKPYGTLTDTCDNLVRSCAYGSFLMLQYLYSHHFDVINLIEKGLALEAPKDMYKL